MISSEQVKTIDLVAFCERCYGMHFVRKGGEYFSHSPFRAEKNPSFVVHRRNGHWLFKDFSSDKGGSIIDFVREQEQLPDDYAAITARMEELLRHHRNGQWFQPAKEGQEQKPQLSGLFEIIRTNPVAGSRSYLQKRDISDQVIERLIDNDQLFTNVYRGQSYCCFAVRDKQGRLMCLDNHQIDGDDKFVLGKKHVFVSDYTALAQAEEVTITESIIDLLSMKTLFRNTVGLALLGTSLAFSPGLIADAKKLMLALDNDDAGDRGRETLKSRFADKQFEDFRVGDYKDVNEVLHAFPNIATKRKKFSPLKKVSIYRAYLQCRNKSEVARRFDIDRSYLSEIIAECDEVLLCHFEQKKPGRPKADAPKDFSDALDKIETLQSSNVELAKQKEELFISNEFLKLRLSWAERDPGSDKPACAGRKRHLKKKRNRRR